MNDDPRPDVTSLAPGTSALLVTPDATVARDRVLTALGGVDPETAVLLLATRDAGAAVEELRSDGVSPARIGVVDASGVDASIAGVAEADAVPDPGSLPALGIATSDLLDRLDHRYERVCVGLDSVSDLLAGASVPAVFRFLHVLCGRIRSADAVLVATIDGSAHDEETLRTIAELFDETVEIG